MYLKIIIIVIIMDYTLYKQYINNIVTSNDLINFKNNNIYTQILEHVPYNAGNGYFLDINKYISYEQIKEFCNLNDKIGNPNVVNIEGIVCSTTSLRYINLAYKIIQYFINQQITNPDIIEIGGGYGGLLLAINYLAPKFNIKINSYTLIDIDPVYKLQQLYLNNYTIDFPINYINADTYGKDILLSDAFLISCYSFSEIENTLQQNYIKYLFPKIKNGFIVWNSIKLYNFGKNIISVVKNISYESNDVFYVYF